jgi:hypothetical protein
MAFCLGIAGSKERDFSFRVSRLSKAAANLLACRSLPRGPSRASRRGKKPKKRRSTCGCAESTKGGGWRRLTLEAEETLRSINRLATKRILPKIFVHCKIVRVTGQWIFLSQGQMTFMNF